MEHIERMKKELLELEERFEKLNDFLESQIENPESKIDEVQKIYLGMQLTHMNSYIEVLKMRIEYDTEKAEEVSNEK